MTIKTTLKGRAKAGAGKLERAVGEALDDPELRLRGDLDQLDGGLEHAMGDAQQRISAAIDQLLAVIGTASSRAGAAYSGARQRAEAVTETVDPFVHDRPYAALAVAALAGFVVGALCYGGQRVVYVKPRPQPAPPAH